MDIEELKKQLFERGKYVHSSYPAKPSLEHEALSAIKSLQRELEEARRDAERYLRLVGSGDFVPSIFGGWALRALTDKYATKAELDAAIDRDAARSKQG